MAGNRFNRFSNLGVGVGLRVPHYQHILTRKPVVGWFEIISENYMVDGGRPLEILDRILEQYHVVQHGVSMYLGSTDPLNREHLRRLKNLVRRTGTPWVSDHLCWGSVDGTYSHDLLPLPYTPVAARHVARRIRAVRDILEVPLVVENVSSYAEFQASTMTEWEFLNEVVELADCGILLDVNNIYVSSRNHNFDAFEYLEAVPPHRVAQIHIAGHSKFEKYILDTHDHPVLDPVWKLYGRAVERCGPTPTLLEWDAHIPSFGEVHREALKANRFIARHTQSPVRPQEKRREPIRPDARSVAGLRDIQRRMAGAIFRPLTAERRTLPRWRDGRRMSSFASDFIKPNDRLTSLERLEIYNRTYWFRVIDCIYDDFPGLRAVMGERRFDAYTEAYLTECPSRSFTLRDLGSRVEWFLTAHPEWTQPRPRLVLDMARFEWAQVVAFDEGARLALSSGDLLGQDPGKLRVGLQPYITLLNMAYPLDDFLLAVKRDEGATDGAANAVGKQSENQARRPGRKVKLPRPAETFLAVHRHENSLYYKRLEPRAFALLRLLGEGKSLGRACEVALRDVEGEQDQWMAKVRGWFENWMSLGWFCSAKKNRAKARR